MKEIIALKEDEIELIGGGIKGREKKKKIRPKTREDFCICPKCGGQRLIHRACPNCGYSEEDDVPEE